MTRPKSLVKKSETSRAKILEAALEVFQEHGFQSSTMAEIAAKAGVARGAAYYYFDSKDAIVMAFYERSQAEMAAETGKRLDSCNNLEQRLRTILALKFEYLAPHRKLLGALSSHTDPHNPLSPFSAATEGIRKQDFSLFARAIRESRINLPPGIEPYLPRLLWLYQLGLILYWVYDDSPGQRRTEALFSKSLQIVLFFLRYSGFSMLGPLHRLTLGVLDAVYGPDSQGTGVKA